eukprot:2685867-Rhodomonas_salina.1
MEGGVPQAPVPEPPGDSGVFNSKTTASAAECAEAGTAAAAACPGLGVAVEGNCAAGESTAEGDGAGAGAGAQRGST